MSAPAPTERGRFAARTRRTWRDPALDRREGRSIAGWRRRLGWTREELAARTGYAPRSITEFEGGRFLSGAASGAIWRVINAAVAASAPEAVPPGGAP